MEKNEKECEDPFDTCEGDYVCPRCKVKKAERLANAVAFYLTVTDCRDKPFDSRAVHEASEHMKKALIEYGAISKSPGEGKV